MAVLISADALLGSGKNLLRKVNEMRTLAIILVSAALLAAQAPSTNGDTTIDLSASSNSINASSDLGVNPQRISVSSAADAQQVVTAVAIASKPRLTEFGDVFELTATVTPVPAPGKVTFYEGQTILGIVPLQGNTASLTQLSLLPGLHKVHAYFQGSTGYDSSTSPSLVLPVFSAPSRSLATASALTVPSSESDYNHARGKIITADFNHDGILDVAFLDGGMFVALGNGDGSFKTPSQFLSGCGQIEDFEVLDTTGTGNLDLVVTNGCADPPPFAVWFVTIFKGAGDGTFQQVYNELWDSFIAKSGDLNGDGISDLVLTGNSPSILLGNGDGSFSGVFPSETDFDVNAYDIYAIADLNQDGKPDVLCKDDFGNVLTVQLGNGDGNFHGFVTTNLGININAIPAVSDFNRDGIPDIAVPTDGGVQVFFGKGDGSFQLPGTLYPVTTGSVVSLNVGDINADGVADLIWITSDCSNCNNLGTLYGKPDGTFESQTPLGSLGNNTALGSALGAFNHDSRVDLLTIYPASGQEVLATELGSKRRSDADQDY